MAIGTYEPYSLSIDSYWNKSALGIPDTTGIKTWAPTWAGTSTDYPIKTWQPTFGSNANAAQATTTSVAAAGLVGSAISALGGAVSGMMNARALKKISRYQAEIEERNAQMNELSAHMALEQSNWQIGQITRRAGLMMATQRTQQGASGLRIGVGSHAENLASTEILKEIDVNQQYVNGYREAWGIRSQGLAAQNRAVATRASGLGISTLGAFIAGGAPEAMKGFRTYYQDVKEIL